MGQSRGCATQYAVHIPTSCCRCQFGGAAPEVVGRHDRRVSQQLGSERNHYIVWNSQRVQRDSSPQKVSHLRASQRHRVSHSVDVRQVCGEGGTAGSLPQDGKVSRVERSDPQHQRRSPVDRRQAPETQRIHSAGAEDILPAPFEFDGIYLVRPSCSGEYLQSDHSVCSVPGVFSRFVPDGILVSLVCQHSHSLRLLCKLLLKVFVFSKCTNDWFRWFLHFFLCFFCLMLWLRVGLLWSTNLQTFLSKWAMIVLLLTIFDKILPRSKLSRVCRCKFEEQTVLEYNWVFMPVIVFDATVRVLFLPLSRRVVP